MDVWDSVPDRGKIFNPLHSVFMAHSASYPISYGGVSGEQSGRGIKLTSSPYVLVERFLLSYA
jgi:hypothetical protein